MQTNINKIANIIKFMTYDEVMEMADWFSGWTIFDIDGNEMSGPSISREGMASNLSDWADEHMEEPTQIKKSA